MSKAILIIDMPKSCDGCILHGTMIGKQICNAEIKRVKDESVKPKWCPLREVPKKMKVCGKYPQEDQIVPSYKIGYNACIDELLGGENK